MLSLCPHTLENCRVLCYLPDLGVVDDLTTWLLEPEKCDLNLTMPGKPEGLGGSLLEVIIPDAVIHALLGTKWGCFCFSINYCS